MRSFFLFALCGLALSCAPGEYTKAGVCTVCSVCPVGQYRSGGCSGTTNSVCTVCRTCWSQTYATGGCVGTLNRDCGSCSICGSGTWRSAGCSGSTNSICSNCTTCNPTTEYRAAACTPMVNTFCQACTTTDTCVEGGQAPYQRISGICGGPSGASATQCLPPGLAICEACPNQARLSYDEGGLEVTCSATPQYDTSFWAYAPNNVPSCCDAILDQRDLYVEVEGEPMPASRNAWLYDNFITCTGIRTIYPVP